MRSSTVSRHSRQFPDRRRGALFHYYLIYLLLTSTLLALAGVCIHSVLKADQRDSELSRQQRTLLRLQQVLRTDATEAANASREDDQLILTFDDESVVQWELDENIVNRTAVANQQLAGRERFVFSAGTESKFDFDDARRMLTLRLTDPPYVRTSGSQPPNADASPRRFVELLFQLPESGGSP